MTIRQQHNGRIRAVVFDMGGVLIPPPFRLWSSAGAQLGIRPGAFFESFFDERLIEHFHKLERGEITLGEFAEHHVDCIPSSAYDTAMHDRASRVKEIARILSLRSVPEAQPRAWMMKAVADIRKSGIKVALLTNNWFVDESKRDSLVLVDPNAFDIVVESCRVGTRKPERTIYDLICDKLKMKPSECAFLDDLGHNLAPAKEMGFTTIKVSADKPKLALLELGEHLNMKLIEDVANTTAIREGHHLPVEKLGAYPRIPRCPIVHPNSAKEFSLKRSRC